MEATIKNKVKDQNKVSKQATGVEDARFSNPKNGKTMKNGKLMMMPNTSYDGRMRLRLGTRKTSNIIVLSF